MNIFNTAISKVDKVKEDIETAKTSLHKKLQLLSCQQEYIASAINAFSDINGIAKDKIIFSDVEKYGIFDSFGMTVHPKLSKTPYNILNFKTTTGYVFKNNATITLNGDPSESLLESLKHDSIEGKGFQLEEYDTDELTIELNFDVKNPLGSLKFNMLEIQPYLPGSFIIEYIEVFERGNSSFPAQRISGLKNVAAQRIIFTEKTAVSKVTINIKLLYKNSNNRYPFGLKHLYFLDADFINDSYIIVRADKNEYFSYIYDDIVVKDQFGLDTEAKCSEQGIEFYSKYDGDMLSREIELSTDTDPSYIAVNIKSCYIKIPLNTSMISILPDIRTESEEDRESS